MEIEIYNNDWSKIKEVEDKIDLIYLDPPFCTQKRHKMTEKDKDLSFDDTWENIEEYVDWMYNVILCCFDKLSDAGSIYLHNNFITNCEIYHHLPYRIKRNLMSNIYWKRSHPHNNIKNSWGNIVDNIMVITKTGSPYFKVQYVELDEKYKKGSFNNKDSNGYYSLAPITGEKSRLGYMFSYKGYTPTYGWRHNKEKIQELDEQNLIHFGKNKPYKKKYFDESKGTPMGNIWTDIHPVTRMKKQYPTQKPISLLERIITSSCPPDGIVADIFAGSGTTGIAAIKTEIPKKVYLIDENEDAVEISKKNVGY